MRCIRQHTHGRRCVTITSEGSLPIPAMVSPNMDAEAIQDRKLAHWYNSIEHKLAATALRQENEHEQMGKLGKAYLHAKRDFATRMLLRADEE